MRVPMHYQKRRFICLVRMIICILTSLSTVLTLYRVAARTICIYKAGRWLDKGVAVTAKWKP